MQLNNLKPAWRQLKLLNSMSSLDSKEILSIIEGNEANNKTSFQGLLLNIAMFIVIAICCQGG